MNTRQIHGAVVYLLCVYKTPLNDVTIAAGSTSVATGLDEKLLKRSRNKNEDRGTGGLEKDCCGLS